MDPSLHSPAGRKRRIAEASRAYLQIETVFGFGSERVRTFNDLAAKAVALAALRLGRDPLELAEWLVDGRIADLVRAADLQMPVAFRDPTPAEAGDCALEDVRQWVIAEEKRIEQRLRRLAKEFRELREALEPVERRNRFWAREWRTVARELDGGQVDES